MEEILAKVKLALRITEDAFDSELTDLINACILDLGIAGVEHDEPLTNALIIRAICTYCKMHFGTPEEYERLKASYDEQKAQMSMATGYTTWTEVTH